MKWGIWGKGKTGQEVIHLLREEKSVTIFDSTNIPTTDKLKELDILIIFVPGDIFLSYLDVLKSVDLPLVIGSTGFTLTDEIKQELIYLKRSWIWSQNFSLGIQWVRLMLESLTKMNQSSYLPKTQLHEIHHIHKKDAPSGTALLMSSWCPFPVEITSERKGDVVGFHQVTFRFPHETIVLSHDAHSRSIFAEGAVTVAKEWIHCPLGYGFFSLNDLINQRNKS